MIFAKTFSASPSVKTERRLQQPFAPASSRSIFNLFQLPDVGDDFVQQRVEISCVGSGKLMTVISFSSSVGNFHHGRNQDDGLETVLQVQRDFLELADDGEIVLAPGTDENP